MTSVLFSHNNHKAAFPSGFLRPRSHWFMASSEAQVSVMSITYFISFILLLLLWQSLECLVANPVGTG